MSAETRTLWGRIDRTPWMARVAAVDLAIIVAVLLVGVYNHHGLAGVTDPVEVADTAIPFLVGWVVAALATGVYRESSLASLPRAAGYAFGTWFVADLVGQAIRGTPFFGGNADLVFFLVMLAIGGGLLTLWRVVASAVR